MMALACIALAVVFFIAYLLSPGKPCPFCGSRDTVRIGRGLQTRLDNGCLSCGEQFNSIHPLE